MLSCELPSIPVDASRCEAERSAGQSRLAASWRVGLHGAPLTIVVRQTVVIQDRSDAQCFLYRTADLRGVKHGIPLEGRAWQRRGADRIIFKK